MLVSDFYQGSFSYTSRARFIFIRGGGGGGGGGLSYTSRAGFNFMRVLCLTHPMPAAFLSGEFLLHIPCFFFSLFFL